MKKLVKERLYENDQNSSLESEVSSHKKGYHTNIEKDTLDNDLFRKVLYTGEHLQLVLMTLKEGENIGMEVHENDQFFRFESGDGQVVINDTTYEVKDDDIVIVPAGSKHDIINTGSNPLKMYTLYGPPHHADKVINKTKEEAENNEKDFDGQTTE